MYLDICFLDMRRNRHCHNTGYLRSASYHHTLRLGYYAYYAPLLFYSSIARFGRHTDSSMDIDYRIVFHDLKDMMHGVFFERLNFGNNQEKTFNENNLITFNI